MTDQEFFDARFAFKPGDIVCLRSTLAAVDEVTP